MKAGWMRYVGNVISVTVVFWAVVAAGQFGGVRRGLSEQRAFGHGMSYPEDNEPGVWSGSQEEVERLVAEARKQYGFEETKHKGRNATMLIPATFDEMQLELKRGNRSGWREEPLDYYHQESSGLFRKGAFRNGWNYVFDSNISSASDENVKFTAPDGREVVYNRATGRIVTSELLGTKNFVPQYRLFEAEHKRLDVTTHNKDDQYKYVGILYETDPNNPNKYYIVDGQTGRRMTEQQVKTFPTTLTDMWKDMGLVCVPEDAEDLVPPQEPEPIEKEESKTAWGNSDDKQATVSHSWTSRNHDNGLGSAGNKTTWQQSRLEVEAQAAVERTLTALKAGRLDNVYGMLPESYKRDISRLVSAYVGKIDPDVFRMGVEVLGAFGNVLVKQSGNILGLVEAGMIPTEWDLPADEVLAKVLSVKNLRLVGQCLAGAREWLNYGALSRGELSGLLGNAKFCELMRATWEEGGVATAGLKVRLVGDETEAEGVAWLELGSDESGFDSLEMVKVEGCWVPRELAEEWSSMIGMALKQAEQFSLDAEMLDTARTILPELKSAMTELEKAETFEEFSNDVMLTVMVLGLAASM